MKLLSLLFILTFAFSAHAVDVESQTIESRNYLSAGLEYAQFTLEGGSITGSSIKVDFTHYFTSSLSIQMFLASAVNSSSSSSFTSLGGYGFYTVTGDCCTINRSVTMEGAPLIIESTNKKNSFKVGAGIDQVFLNGSKSVYSISGLGLAAEYDFKMFNRLWKASGRYSMMSSNNNDITGLFFALQMTFGL